MEDIDNSSGLFAWAYGGVDFDLAGNGGIECRDFISIKQRIIETLISCAAAGMILYGTISHLTLPKNPVIKPDPVGKRILLVIHCLIFGIELGFKFATKQMIYIVNPCHVATMMQIFCLAAPPGRLTTTVFRLHLHMLTGAPIAILFPVTNTRLLPFETEVYYIQHLLMLVIPFYLLKIGGSYTAESVLDFSWALVSMGVLYIIYFVPVQLLAYKVITEAMRYLG
ncbi:transmembrane protein 164-like isoform X2 [Ostrea edulis]|uniref:transmembrane protein 164-like isoform X2 n=1 Tax=Ostrea edulis TaxID=37623 RepID=UPI002095AE1E|nr:transmembrane protein 164-like isoform X2 [Ostrea edulis]